ncbi:MAG: deoxyribodipyrimidine photo-lyase [Chloroflexota bacterium]|nr:deoxyribodipyrimidine photo-lyase [Chloroflexota bacterium]
MSKEKISIVWFKKDLRINDNLALISSSETNLPVLPLYIFETDYWNQDFASQRHWKFIHDCLIDLNKDLKKIGQSLIIRIGAANNIFENIIKNYDIQSVFAHQETGNSWTYKRDKDIRILLKKNRILFKEFPNNGVVRGLKDRNDWSKIRNSRMYKDNFESPLNLIPISNIISDHLPNKENKFLKNKSNGITQKGGRVEGLKILNSFLNERSKYYLKNLSKPEHSVDSSSRLSPFLSNGVISVKEIINEYRKRKESNFSSSNVKGLKRNISAFNSRLSWRCHFIQKLEDQPDIEFKSMHSAYEGIRDNFNNEFFFKSWMEGKTGFPIVDACMRSLIKTGWLPFRMRAMLVSFASYNLLIDWKKSGTYLAKLFTDFEPGIHYSQMQMQSGVTGINAVRIYNPIKQSYDQDPEGTFIRKWVDELRFVHKAYIHEPWKMSSDLQEKFKCKIGTDYPNPIIDQKESSKFAKNLIYSVRKSKNFKENSAKVFNKLGSRKNISSKKRVSQMKNKDQLSLID